VNAHGVALLIALARGRAPAVTCNTLCVRTTTIDPRVDQCLDDALVLVGVPAGSFAFAIDLP
jgi:hypothetical protein